jgi:hypothetical protein
MATKPDEQFSLEGAGYGDIILNFLQILIPSVGLDLK